jgi:hypothetical protein
MIMKNSRRYTVVSAAACFTACIGEFVAMFVYGAQYPGYSHLKDTMSSMGASVSPVSDEISVWWVTMGVLLIMFGTGLNKAFSEKGKYASYASWLVILYGIGEGIGSGVFKANRISNELSTSALIHDFLGGIGVITILLFPLIMQKVITKKEMPFFHRMSQIIFISGIITVVLFLFRYSQIENNFVAVYKGLWQRLFMLNTYIYLFTTAVLMIRRQKHLINKHNKHNEYI